MFRIVKTTSLAIVALAGAGIVLSGLVTGAVAGSKAGGHAKFSGHSYSGHSYGGRRSNYGGLKVRNVSGRLLGYGPVTGFPAHAGTGYYRANAGFRGYNNRYGGRRLPSASGVLLAPYGWGRSYAWGGYPGVWRGGPGVWRGYRGGYPGVWGGGYPGVVAAGALSALAGYPGGWGGYPGPRIIRYDNESGKWHSNSRYNQVSSPTAIVVGSTAASSGGGDTGGGATTVDGGGCAAGAYCTIRLGPYSNSPKIITLNSSGKAFKPDSID